MPITSPPSALIVSANRRASSGTSTISATVSPLLLAGCLLRAGLRFLVDGVRDVFVGMPVCIACHGGVTRASPGAEAVAVA